MVIQHDDGAIGNVLFAQAREVLPQGAFREVIEVKVECSVEYAGAYGVAPASWSAPGHWRFGGVARFAESASGLAHSKTLRVFGRLLHGEQEVYEMRRFKTALCRRQVQRLAHRALELLFAFPTLRSPASRIWPRTHCCRLIARAKCDCGFSRLGACGSPASRAHSAAL